MLPGGDDAMPGALQEPPQDVERRLVVLHHEEPEGRRACATVFASIGTLFVGRREDPGRLVARAREFDDEGGSLANAFTFRGNSAAVQVHNGPG